MSSKKVVKIGDVLIGGGNPIAIQSMANVNPLDEVALTKQIEELSHEGCQIIRLAVPSMEAAEVFGRVKRKIDIPMVADIHFDYRLAIEAISQGADKIRINPGNIGSKENLQIII